jgi:hypothetical protein
MLLAAGSSFACGGDEVLRHGGDDVRGLHCVITRNASQMLPTYRVTMKPPSQFVGVSVRSSGTALRGGSRSFEIRRGNSLLLIYLILPAALCRGVYSAFNKMGTRDRNKKYLSEVERGVCVRETTSPPSVSRFSRQYGNLNTS